MKTKVDIINETVEYYSSDVSRRSLFTYTDIDGEPSSDCMYNGDNGNKCAFSRCCKDDVIFSEVENTNADGVLDMLGYNILKDEYRIEDNQFWNQLQQLHDIPNHWNSEGITDKGLQYANSLKEKYSDKD